MWRRRAFGRRGGRAIALTGVALGVAFLFGQMLAGDRAFAALMKGSLAALAVMAVGGAFQSLWRGDRVQEAEAAGVRVKFRPARRSLEELDRHVRTTMDDLDERLSRLERKVVNGERD